MSKWAQLQQYKKLYSFVGVRSTHYLIFGVIAGILVFGAELTFTYVLQMLLVVMKIIPSKSVYFPSWISDDNMYLFLVFVTVILLVRGFSQWLNAYLTSASYEIQRDYQRYRLMEWSLRAHSVNSSQLITLYNQGIDSVCAILSNFQSMSVALSTSGLIWIFMLKLSVKTTLIATGGLAVIAFFSRYFDNYTRREGQKLLARMEDLNFQLLSNIKNLLLVQIYGTQDKERKILKTRLTESLKGVLSFHKIIHIKIIIPQIVGFVLICGLSVAATRRGWLSSTLMVTYFYLFIRFVQNFSEVVKQNSTIIYHLPIALKFAKWWADNSHDGIRNPVIEDPSRDQMVEVQGPVAWKLNNISYSYPGSNHQIFENFSLNIPAGSALVIIGESGSGKSTLLSVLLGLITLEPGKVEIGLEDQWYSLNSIRKSILPHIGYVGSESFLISGTILENLLYGLDHRPSENQLSEALKKSGCDFISKLSDGMNHQIMEQGQGLSAGQKQRLAFARALLRNPKVLILDEATANLDSETEKYLIQTLLQLKGSTTIIAVTHREALLTLADQTVRLPIEQ